MQVSSIVLVLQHGRRADTLLVVAVFVAGYQSPTPRPRRGSWEEVSRGLLCRVKYGGGLDPPDRYGSHEGLLRTLKSLANGALVKLGGPITH